jgi:hypothetical protein
MATPSDWPQCDREALWSGLLREVDRITSLLVPEAERRTSEIFLVNAKLEMPVAPQGQHDRSRSIKKILNSLSRVGQVLEINVGGSGEVTGMAPEVASELDGTLLSNLVRSVDEAAGANAKGRALETLVALLFGSVLGLKVHRKRVRTKTEEIDVVVLNGSHDPRFEREEAHVLVECKNWTGRCGKNEFVEFEKKMRNRKGRCSVGFLVSWNGFADTFTKEMLRGSHERLLIVPLTGEQIRRAVRQGAFFPVLTSAWDEAVSI